MKILGVFLLGGTLIIGTAEARLGESKEQLEARYGKAEKIPDRLKKYALGAECYGFKDENYFYIYYLVENKAEALALVKKNKGVLTEEEIEEFLKENSSGNGFKKDQEQKIDSKFTQIYMEPGENKFAVWEKNAGVVSICTKKWGEKNGDEAVLKQYLSDEEISRAKEILQKERSKVKNESND